MRRPKLHHILPMGLTKLICIGRIISLFSKVKFMLIKLSIPVALHTASLQCRENFRFDAIELSLNTEIFDILYAFEFYSTHFVFMFLVSCCHLAFVKVEKHFPPIRPCWDFAQIFRKFCLSWSEITEFPIFVSSVNFAIRLLSPIFMSFMYIMNSTGPRTEPCGTPVVTGAQFAVDPLITTFCFLLHS